MYYDVMTLLQNDRPLREHPIAFIGDNPSDFFCKDIRQLLFQFIHNTNVSENCKSYKKETT